MMEDMLEVVYGLGKERWGENGGKCGILERERKGCLPKSSNFQRLWRTASTRSVFNFEEFKREYVYQLVASSNLRDTGVIASARAVEIYGLNILAERIKLELELTELLKSRRGCLVSIASLSLLYQEKYRRTLQAEGYLTESQRHGKAGYSLTKPHGQHAVVLAEVAPRYMEYINDKSDPGGVVAGSRQIYLTFPVESTFTKEDVSNYFKIFCLDVINLLNSLRGKGMTSMYSWSSKRYIWSYKNGFVWHDLSENAYIYPVHGQEYVLKGSELMQAHEQTIISSEKLPQMQRSSDEEECDFQLMHRHRLKINFDEEEEPLEKKKKKKMKRFLHLNREEISPPPSSSSPETLETLIEADKQRSNSYSTW
ncbi:hypothetical protein IFM89_002789 [Coptis chinensis]|uniref:SOSEKI DIX-like domain-containing protein n=1 Tax=Coptis chinensis TaxID=261450 RepID=A0A835HT06_9MAGN|nr:hypothetical protein IFM89_002789 [Coptis chinensis]